MGKSYIAHCQSGYYGYNRKVHVGNPISGHEYAQCGWNREYHEGKMIIQLISYETVVCEIVGQANYALDDWLHCYGTFSQTTRKHIAWFMREMEKVFGYKTELCNYSTAKNCYEKDIEINLHTGEIRKASHGMIQTVGIPVRDW